MNELICEYCLIFPWSDIPICFAGKQSDLARRHDDSWSVETQTET